MLCGAWRGSAPHSSLETILSEVFMGKERGFPSGTKSSIPLPFSFSFSQHFTPIATPRKNKTKENKKLELELGLWGMTNNGSS